MALEGLLAKLGPTVVRELSPHLLQLLSGFTERFRSDTRDMKAAVDAEITSLSQSHANLVTSIDQQRDRLDSLQSHVVAVDQKVDRLQQSLAMLAQQMTAASTQAEASQRTVRYLATFAAAFSLLAFGVGVAGLVLHR